MYVLSGDKIYVFSSLEALDRFVADQGGWRRDGWSVSIELYDLETGEGVEKSYPIQEIPVCVIEPAATGG